jgi:hypothetical protein
VLRPDDLLNLEISAINLRVDAAGDTPSLVADDRARPALLIVHFPAQTIFEEAFFEQPKPSDNPAPVQDDAKNDPREAPAAPGLPQPGAPGTTKFKLGAQTRLVFRVPADARIPYTIEGVLDWSSFELVVTPAADVPFGATAPPEALTIREPREDETTLQLPFRLHLSPTHASGWEHATGLVDHGGRTEMWHTRLVARADDGTTTSLDDEHTIGLRAVWSPDYVAGQKVPPPTDSGLPGAIAAMNTADRHQIVILTSAFVGWAETETKAFVPEPIHASMVMLSPLGGWLRSHGKWNPPARIKPQRYRFPRFDEILKARDFARPLTEPPIEQEPGAPAADIGERDVFVEDQVHPVLDVEHQPTKAFVYKGTDLITTIDPARFAIARYDVDEGTRLDLSQWVHLAAQGRDHYVRIVYEGNLCDTGHRAALVKVTERRFETLPGGSEPIAFLRQYMYIVIREPEKVYANEGLAYGGLGLPFKRIRLTTLVTAHIDYPYKIQGSNPAYVPPGEITGTDKSFWITIGGQPFMFHGIAEDVHGNLVDFAKAMVFVPFSETAFASIQAEVTSADGRKKLAANVPGQKIAFAVNDPASTKDNTSFVASSFMLGNEGTTRDTFFKPNLFKADVTIPAVEALTGSSTPTSIAYVQEYLDKGFTDAAFNASGAFAKVIEMTGTTLVDADSNAAFNAAQAGGFATPQLGVTNLTRDLGPLGGKLADALGNAFNPADVFPKGTATLFGVFDLADLVDAVSASGDAPRMTVDRSGTTIISKLDWSSKVKDINVGLVEFKPGNGTKFDVHIEIRMEIGGVAGSSTINGKLGSFELIFLESLDIHFTSFTFKSASGSKTDVNVALNDQTPVEFIGDLKFVEGLRQLIPPGVFGDGVSIDLIQNPLGVKAGLAISLPPAAVGVFSLKNIAFAAGLTVPFIDGKPVAEFSFARRDAQFLLAVLIFGGGGFFHVEVDTDGMKMLEAAFEFGATAALDIGVASGEVHIMAGIYFKIEKKAPANDLVATLSGYLRCGGSLCVLGIVRISVEFCLSFTYYSDIDKAKGRATLTVEVEVLCFSKSVELTVERAFGGSGDPTFEQMMPVPELWAEYTEAFA